jgi:CBS domain-containing protein
MARTDIYLDAMLRHLGAAYYESLHGRAPRSDVNRALDTVEEHLHEEAAARTRISPPARHENGPRHRRWARRVSDVMTASVVTVDRATSFQEIDRLLTERRISGVPVLKMGRQVAGVVSEADLLAAEDETARQARLAGSVGRHGIGQLWHRKQAHVSLTAGALMTAPAITIGPDATIPAAARLMNTHRVRRLPVVADDGRLVGIVSRRDLLSIFLRPDADVAHDARQVLDELPLADPKDVVVAVKHGVVTLSGPIRPGPGEEDERDLLPLALRLIWDIDGVVDVVNRLGEAAVPPAARTA